MRKLLLAVGILLLAGNVWAGDITFQKPNLAADLIFDLQEDSFGCGSGWTLAKACKDILELRAEYVTLEKQGTSSKIGAGIGVNIPALLRELGATWIPEKLNPSIGALALVDFKDEPKLSVGIYLTVLRIDF